MMARTFRICLLLLAGLLSAAETAPAAEVPRGVLLAADDEGWGVRKVMARFKTRSGVVQLCIIAMALGLFILMRKLADPAAPRSPTPSDRLSGKRTDPRAAHPE